ncbi:hypothetical protein A4A49_08223 [Nicotiana attenuata]|uniref:Uncharacterized protein n=1 Tax=Nicotiana attenuata TaxID=49451 RepID=A0A314LDL4_NICAT|nr:hypothetical protein A4A49_08223 [Nicotiana attenuata]
MAHGIRLTNISFQCVVKNASYKEVWHTASLYHLVHTAALVSAPITKHPNIFGGLLTGGIIAFSGTCYAVELLEVRKYSTLAPFGGFAFIAASASYCFRRMNVQTYHIELDVGKLD